MHISDTFKQLTACLEFDKHLLSAKLSNGLWTTKAFLERKYSGYELCHVQYHDMLLDGGSYHNYPVPAPEMTCVEKKPHIVNMRYA